MSRRDSSDSSSSDSPSAAPTVLCVICDQAAVGVGPFSHAHLCQRHLSVDVADAHKLKEKVAEQLCAYSQGAGAGAASSVAALGLGEGQSAGSLRLHIRQHLQQVEQRFDQVQRDLDSFRRRVTGQLESLIEALSVCEQDLEDVSSYKQEVATAEAADNMSELVYLVESMQASLGDLEADFERAACLQRDSSDSEELQLRLLGQLERLVDRCAVGADATDWSREVEVTAISEEIDAAVRKRMLLFDPIVFSHDVMLDVNVEFLAVCSDTSGFVGDRSDRVVSSYSASDGSEALPQPCIIASFHPNKDHLLLLSVNGSQKLRCHCDIDWKKAIWGLHCDRQLLFIAQHDAVTVMDLSGRAVRRIHPHIEAIDDISGIGGNAASVFVSSGNKIAAFSKATGQMETIITLSPLPDARLGNLVFHDNCILVTDWERKQVHRVRIDTQQLVASYRTQSDGLKKFANPVDLGVDKRGRLFKSECCPDSLRAVAADDGSLLWTLGEPGESGSGDYKFYYPCGIALVPGVHQDQLLVADRNNNRLLVFNA